MLVASDVAFALITSENSAVIVSPGEADDSIIAIDNCGPPTISRLPVAAGEGPRNGTPLTVASTNPIGNSNIPGVAPSGIENVTSKLQFAPAAKDAPETSNCSAPSLPVEVVNTDPSPQLLAAGNTSTFMPGTYSPTS
ncbi:Uncharacterised protein [BD1-7 clade bacterium]|uniref:Uncharacterized protein n=1 Tax=BD1-7 clade bacterium TaxID=2029982 RepID=A0A5S9NWB6_9GAMM|nr:Uncharacterised protein [BD1-7 clade bacterium]CAA0095007.1 Uncharacterised protein [BD1-7 clade bacterium]